MKNDRVYYVITGSGSGLGKYLRDQLGGTAFKRDGTTTIEKTDVIIHCAVNKTRDVTSENLYQYLSDNVLLTKKLAQIPHKKFIFVSSIDVYPKNNQKHSESEVIDVTELSSMYAITKLMSEVLIQNLCPNFLILRCSALLGQDSRENTLIKMIKAAHPTLTVSAHSVFNFISHKDVLAFIKIAIAKDLQGIYNLSASENITLAEVAKLLGKKVTFGNYLYNTGDIDNKKVSQVLPAFQKTSREVIDEFRKTIL